MATPSRDPTCERYINDPRFVWYCSAWRTVEGAERLRRSRDDHARTPRGRETKRRHNQRTNPQRVIVGGIYCGLVGFTQSDMEELRGATQRP